MHVTLEKYHLRESYFEAEIRSVECGHMFSLYFCFYFVTSIGILLTTWLKHGLTQAIHNRISTRRTHSSVFAS